MIKPNSIDKAGITTVRIIAICAFLFINSVSFGQKSPLMSHAFNERINSDRSQLIGPMSKDSIRILAIMVEFQKDTDPQTNGDGTFLKQGSSAQIDPPPHDSTYFKNKIRFVDNYFRKVSNGKLSIAGTIYGQDSIKLTKQMISYSPPISTSDNSKLAELAIESWQKADSLYPGIDFSKYDLFVIFHAGVGRDIDLVSSLGYNPTPYDIPSLYLDSTAFATALGQPSFTGIVNGYLKNTIILPETESRDIPVISGTMLIQFGINGMFAASIGSYLGLPDLFDTKTGRSGIGQFGLMDGAGIFAYSGLFPPEPSAWEKYWIGWATPITINISSDNISVPAAGLSYSANDTIFRIPISSSEYFLIENRNRNPFGSGIDLTLATLNGDSIVHYNQDVDGFNSDDVSGIHGNVVDVSNYDWALKNWSTDDAAEKFYGGGLLIWHIDENVIQNGLASNTINANPDHRGIDLEEADGSKDIGQIYEDLTAGSGTENGSPLDCWFNGNPAAIYKNIFGLNTFPNSNSFSGAASVITIKNFSEKMARMTFSVDIGNSLLQKDTLLNRSLSNVKTFPTSTKNHLYIPTNHGIYAINNNGFSLTTDPSGLLSTTGTDHCIAVNKLSDTTEIIASVQDSTLRIFRLSLTSGLVVADSVSLLNRIASSTCFAQLDSLSILLGDESGTFYQFNINGGLIRKRSVGSEPVSSITFLPKTAYPQSYEYFFTSGDRIFGELDSIDLPVSSNKWIITAAVSPNGNYIAALEKGGNRIISLDQSLSNKYFEMNTAGSPINEAAIADINGDGEKDIIAQSANNLLALNRNGYPLDGFPISAKTGLEFTGTPLIVDFNGDNSPEIVLLTNDGEIWAYDGVGKLLSGFPVQVTSQGKSFPMAYSSMTGKLGLAVLSENGSLDAFLSNATVTDGSFYWWQYLGNEKHLNADTIVTQSKPLSSEFLPKSRVYNYPNPVYTRSTKIRYFTSEDANITITILDISGMKITELHGKGTAGMDSEIAWDVSHIQSGIYLARLEAQGSSKSDVTIIKIAVVK